MSWTLDLVHTSETALDKRLEAAQSQMIVMGKSWSLGNSRFRPQHLRPPTVHLSTDKQTHSATFDYLKSRQLPSRYKI